MKLSDGVQDFWSKIRGYALCSALTIALAFYFHGWKMASTIAFFLLVYFFWFLSNTKEKLIRALPTDFAYENVTIDDYPLVNFTWFQQKTDELKSLGFDQIMDYKTAKTLGFERCFSHPKYFCYADVSEVFTVDGESYRNTVISSGLDKGWSLSSNNREVINIDSIAYGLWCNPKNVRTYHPELRLEELFHKHLQMRQRMIDDIGVSLLTDVSWDNYIEKQQKGVIYRKKAFEQKVLLLAMIEVTRFELNPKSEWLGDYAKFIK